MTLFRVKCGLNDYYIATRRSAPWVDDQSIDIAKRILVDHIYGGGKYEDFFSKINGIELLGPVFIEQPHDD